MAITNFNPLIKNEQKGEAQELLAKAYGDKPMSTPRNYKTFAEEGYQQNLYVYRCLNLIASAVADLPMILYKRNSKGEKEEILKHDVLDLLDRPNPLSDRTMFITSLVNYLGISGNAFVEGQFPKTLTRKGNKPVELWTLRPDRMILQMGRFGLPSKWTYKFGSLEKVFEMNPATGAGPIRHLKLFNPLDDIWGMSPLHPAAKSVDQFNHQGSWNLSLLQRGARPSGIITPSADISLTPEQRQALNEDLRRCFTGSQNSGKVMLLEGGMTWTDTQLSPKDMDYTNAKNGSASDIATAFGVPHQLINIPGSQTYANFEQAMVFFYQYTVKQWANLIYGLLNEWLLPAYGEDLILAYDLDQVDALEPLRQKRWDKAQNASWLTINEKRELTGYGKYEPIKEGEERDPADQILIDGMKVPLEYVTEDLAVEPLEDIEDVNPDSDQDPEDPDEGDDPDGDEELEDTEDVDEDEGLDPEKEPVAAKALLKKADERSLVFADGRLFDISEKAGRGRKGFWRRQERRRMKFEQRMRGKVQALFKQEASLIKKYVVGAEPGMQENMMDRAITESNKKWNDVLKKDIRVILESYGEDIFKLQKSIDPEIEEKLFGDFGFQGAFEEFIRKYLERDIARKITNIQRVSRKRIMNAVRKAIADGIIDGESNIQVAEKIQEVYKGMSKPRALTIARTETHTASQTASVEAAKALELPDLQKEWVSAQDDRTREDHVIANGSLVNIDEKFMIVDLDSGDEIAMDRPGDPSAPANQVINCRCVVAFPSKKRR